MTSQCQEIHIFKNRVSFLRILRKLRTFPMGRMYFFAKSRNRMRFAIHDARLATKHDAVTPCRALHDARRTTVVLPAAPLVSRASGRCLVGIHRRFSPLALPTSEKAFYNIWPSVEPRKTQLFHDIWSPFWHLFLADSIPGGAWGSPWEHPGSTFASRLQKTSKKSLFWTSF